MSKTAAERFWEKVEIRGPDDCWPWKAYIRSNGYGAFRLKKHITVKAHRFSYEFIFGLALGKLDGGHLCNNRACVNPWHITPQTRSQNMLYAVECGLNPDANKTHCDHGHEFNEANTYIRPGGGRDCRICRIDRNRRYRERIAGQFEIGAALRDKREGR